MSTLLPRRVGRYLLLEELASGGMATVRLGHCLEVDVSASGALTPEFVAIKCMHSHYASDPDFVSMFLDEATLCTQIHHENVIKTLDVVRVLEELFLVLELCDGESLSRLLRAATERRERVPIAVASAIMIDVLRGLHAAHIALGPNGEPLHIVHRDVSPHNVLIGTDGTAKVLDFGVAKAVGRVQQTQKGQLKGKLAYMSPEQARGKAVDRRSDVFAVGIVLWELLTGARLFDAEHEAALLVALLNEPIPPPSTKDPALAKFDAFIAKALSAEPDQRFPTALAMAEALRALIPPAPKYQVAAWVRQEGQGAIAKRREVLAGARRTAAEWKRSQLGSRAVSAAAARPSGAAPVAPSLGTPSLATPSAPPSPMPIAPPAPVAAVPLPIPSSSEMRTEVRPGLSEVAAPDTLDLPDASKAPSPPSPPSPRSPASLPPPTPPPPRASPPAIVSATPAGPSAAHFPSAPTPSSPRLQGLVPSAPPGAENGRHQGFSPPPPAGAFGASHTGLTPANLAGPPSVAPSSLTPSRLSPPSLTPSGTSPSSLTPSGLRVPSVAPTNLTPPNGVPHGARTTASPSPSISPGPGGSVGPLPFVAGPAQFAGAAGPLTETPHPVSLFGDGGLEPPPLPHDRVKFLTIVAAVSALLGALLMLLVVVLAARGSDRPPLPDPVQIAH